MHCYGFFGMSAFVYAWILSDLICNTIRFEFGFSFAMQNSDANSIRAEIMNASERLSGMHS